MNDIIKNIEAAQLKETVPAFCVGDTVKVYNKIKEGNRERIQIFEGTVIKRQNGGARETFTVRKNSNGIGVEKTWPLLRHTRCPPLATLPLPPCSETNAVPTLLPSSLLLLFLLLFLS